MGIRVFVEKSQPVADKPQYTVLLANKVENSKKCFLVLIEKTQAAEHSSVLELLKNILMFMRIETNNFYVIAVSSEFMVADMQSMTEKYAINAVLSFGVSIQGVDNSLPIIETLSLNEVIRKPADKARILKDVARTTF